LTYVYARFTMYIQCLMCARKRIIMLKKLVKYGNSSALVLDKALLELLNIAEGSVVKIKTDGASLIISRQNVAAQENFAQTITPEEALQEAVQHAMAKYYGNVENANTYMSELKKIFERYSEALKKLNNPEVKQAFHDLEHGFNGNRLDPEYIKAMVSLRWHYVPELIEMDHEIQTLSQKYTPWEQQYANKENKSTFAGAVMDFKRVHEKFQQVQQEVAKLHEDPTFIDESVMLAEEFKVTQNATEYINQLTALIAKYIPAYVAYQDELKKVAELLK
jgi:antitoxin component of MazEF toxin-antitoxin module